MREVLQSIILSLIVGLFSMLAGVYLADMYWKEPKWGLFAAVAAGFLVLVISLAKVIKKGAKF
jgi:ABC-type Mn2+/Zn2+ transport system permease subunit